MRIFFLIAAVIAVWMTYQMGRFVYFTSMRIVYVDKITNSDVDPMSDLDDEEMEEEEIGVEDEVDEEDEDVDDDEQDHKIEHGSEYDFASENGQGDEEEDEDEDEEDNDGDDDDGNDDSNIENDRENSDGGCSFKPQILHRIKRKEVKDCTTIEYVDMIKVIKNPKKRSTSKVYILVSTKTEKGNGKCGENKESSIEKKVTRLSKKKAFRLLKVNSQRFFGQGSFTNVKDFNSFEDEEKKEKIDELTRRSPYAESIEKGEGGGEEEDGDAGEIKEEEEDEEAKPEIEEERKQEEEENEEEEDGIVEDEEWNDKENSEIKPDIDIQKQGDHVDVAKDELSQQEETNDQDQDTEDQDDDNKNESGLCFNSFCNLFRPDSTNDSPEALIQKFGVTYDDNLLFKIQSIQYASESPTMCVGENNQDCTCNEDAQCQQSQLSECHTEQSYSCDSCTNSDHSQNFNQNEDNVCNCQNTEENNMNTEPCEQGEEKETRVKTASSCLTMDDQDQNKADNCELSNEQLEVSSRTHNEECSHSSLSPEQNAKTNCFQNEYNQRKDEKENRVKTASSCFTMDGQDQNKADNCELSNEQLETSSGVHNEECSHNSVSPEQNVKTNRFQNENNQRKDDEMCIQASTDGIPCPNMNSENSNDNQQELYNGDCSPNKDDAVKNCHDSCHTTNDDANGDCHQDCISKSSHGGTFKVEDTENKLDSSSQYVDEGSESLEKEVHYDSRSEHDNQHDERSYEHDRWEPDGDQEQHGQERRVKSYPLQNRQFAAGEGFETERFDNKYPEEDYDDNHIRKPVRQESWTYDTDGPAESRFNGWEYNKYARDDHHRYESDQQRTYDDEESFDDGNSVYGTEDGTTSAQVRYTRPGNPDYNDREENTEINEDEGDRRFDDYDHGRHRYNENDSTQDEEATNERDLSYYEQGEETMNYGPPAVQQENDRKFLYDDEKEVGEIEEENDNVDFDDNDSGYREGQTDYKGDGGPHEYTGNAQYGDCNGWSSMFQRKCSPYS